MFLSPPTKKDVIAALQALENIERPQGDNEEDAINSKAVYPYLSTQQQELVEHAENVVKKYVRKPGDEGDEPNSRSLTELNNAGYRVNLNTDQYDPSRLVGSVTVGDKWKLDVSDPNSQTTDD